MLRFSRSAVAKELWLRGVFCEEAGRTESFAVLAAMMVSVVSQHGLCRRKS
jgi:hypothetical protein